RPLREDECMIADETEPPSPDREPQPAPGNTSDAVRAAAEDDSPAATRRPTAATGLEGGMERAVAALKPRMRGWLHAGVFPLALAGGIVLIAVSRSGAAVAACAVYAVSACLLFGTSAVYHRGTWGPRGEAVLRRLDH